MTRTPPPGMRADAIAYYEKVLIGARSAFADLGLDAELKDISERAGVGMGTIYRHFGNKDGVIAHVIQEAREDINNSVAAAKEADVPPLDRLRNCLTLSLDSVERYGWVIEALLGRRLPRDIQAEIENDRTLGEAVLSILEELVADGTLRKDLDLPLAALLIQSVVLAWIFDRSREEHDAAEAVDRILDIFLNGARA
ncbi:MAG: TetR/AcrR family transcriptional regulator [Dehalococcoidia bacterium]|nr:TetR/AcrR family transcriptional regulator [Dehalococcoidia bacterium]MCA9844012.1 TetR/AcrR family transcriptional regulator [Dehalococcoidia bacterium]